MLIVSNPDVNKHVLMTGSGLPYKLPLGLLYKDYDKLVEIYSKSHEIELSTEEFILYLLGYVLAEVRIKAIGMKFEREIFLTLG